jgi:hypothetical protein
MKPLKSLSTQLQSWLWVFVLASALIIGYGQVLQAKTPAPDANSRSSQTAKVQFALPPPPDQGAPTGRREGGASRGRCLSDAKLIALVPDIQGFTRGFTASAHPTFWFFVPKQTQMPLPVEFVLQNPKDDEIYHTEFIIPKSQPAGVISIPIPATAMPLQMGQSYEWTFSIACTPNQPEAYVAVKGTIQRVPFSTARTSQSGTAPAVEQAARYASEGIWYEALTILAESRRSQSNDSALNSAWTDLLQQVGLSEIASQPIVPCCQAESQIRP